MTGKETNPASPTCDALSFVSVFCINMHVLRPPATAERTLERVHMCSLIMCICAYCISAGHPSRGKAAVRRRTACLAWALHSTLVSHQSPPLCWLAGCLPACMPACMGRDLPTPHPSKDVHFGASTSAHACTGVKTHTR